MKVDFGKSEPFYAYIDDNDNLVIGEERGRDGGILYAGPWKSSKTPYFLNIMEETPSLFNKLIKYYSPNIAAVFTDVLNTQIEKLFDEFEAHLPKALYAQVKEKCLEKQCTSQKFHILTTMDELKDSWEDGYEVVYVPAHFEKKKKGKK